MVLTSVRFLQLSSSMILMAVAIPAAAQELDRATPLLPAPPEYNARPIQLGRIATYFGADARIEYDSNIYALPSNEIDDGRLVVSPWVNMLLKDDRFELGARARGTIRRYFDTNTDNTESGNARLDGTYRLSDVDNITGNLAWARLVEERGEPEGVNVPGTSPRQYDQWRSELGYSHEGARITLGLKGSALRNNARAAADEERDFDQYSGSARMGYRVSGIVSAFGEGFVVARNFDLPVDFSGVDRDSKTYGARAGVAFSPGGLIDGEASVGVFRFKPDDSTLDSRTGLSISAGLTYTPAPRRAVTLDGFRGDVATVRTGAQSRTDTRFRLGVQNEVYHNLRWQTAVVYRRSTFVGSNQHERTIAGLAEIEYLFNHNLAIALTGRIANRDSTRPSDDFDRSLLGMEVRVQY